MPPDSKDNEYCQICDIRKNGQCTGYDNNCSIGSIFEHDDIIKDLEENDPRYLSLILQQPEKAVIISNNGYKCLILSDVEEYKRIDEIITRTTIPSFRHNSHISDDEFRIFHKAVYEKN